MLTLLLPENRFPAIEERYAQWQSELLLTRALSPQPRILRYAPDTPLKSLHSRIDGEFVAIVTNPLMVCRSSLLIELLDAARTSPGDATLPVLNDGASLDRTSLTPRLYLTLAQFDEVASEFAAIAEPERLIEFDGHDPVVYVTRTMHLRDSDATARDFLRDREITVVRSSFVHRYASQRGQTRNDLLHLVDPEAKEILEFGCGEAGLGAALKQRQSCRVVGVELDREAAAVARERIDVVHSGDVRTLVHELGETFDTIIGGDIVEHLDEPWQFLSDLKLVARKGTRLILSLPNIANWAVTSDLLRGRFDYVYLGILCAGHLRFFTRNSLEEMLTIAGWSVESITPQDAIIDERSKQFEEALRQGGIDHSPQDLQPTGWYVIARL
jgi:2-polyprenyl-3-methyl-5-hydroxy-6-metoxy-1,4-benzoquinol methylase